MRLKPAIFIIMTALMATANAQWKEYDRLLGEASYKSAYQLAENRYKKASDGAARLEAAFRMAEAAAYYQEDADDSARARYRALLPELEGVGKALCHSFLDEHDSALAHAEALKLTPAASIAQYCTGDTARNVTTTAFDIICLRAQDRGICTPQQRVDLQRQLVGLHRGDDPYVALWHERRLLQLLDAVPNCSLADSAIVEVIDRYAHTGCPALSNLFAMMARRCQSRGDYLEAVAWCDKGIAVDPKGEGGAECGTLKIGIVSPMIEVSLDGLTVIPGRESLQSVVYRNTDHLWFRVVRLDERRDVTFGTVANKKKLLKAKPVRQWNTAVPSNDSHQLERCYFTVPPLDAGKYALLVSTKADFDDGGFCFYELDATDIYFLNGQGGNGLLLDRASGRPIAGQQVQLVSDQKYDKPLATTLTDSVGCFSFDLSSYSKRWGCQLMVMRDGFRFLSNNIYDQHPAQPEMTLRSVARTDRPIYRPGDTVHIAVVAYHSDGSRGNVAAGIPLEVDLLDPNGQIAAFEHLVTDSFGIAHTCFEVPADRLAGRYSTVVVSNGHYLCSAGVRVEEYKQPKFMVSLDAAQGSAPRFGHPVTVRGMASSYSSVPVAGARVQYTVVRRQLGHYWWRWWGVVAEKEVASGETSTAADGSFAVTFTPQPDSTVELSDRPTFEYVVKVDVTDLNGESHPSEASMRVGYRNAFLSLGDGGMDSLRVCYVDINGNELPGRPDVRVELLRQPDVPLLDHPLLDGRTKHTVTEQEFNSMFPRLAYDVSYNDMSLWEGREVTDYSQTGVYRITLSAPDADTVVEYRTVVGAKATKVPCQKLFWAEVDKTTAHVGDRVTVRFGSRHRDVQVMYFLHCGKQGTTLRRFTINDELRSESFTVDSAMLGGVVVDMIAVLDGVEHRFQQRIEVPFSHKRLQVEVSTFRDKLLPGSGEEWTLKVRGENGGLPAALILTMYDDALNSYGNHDWSFSPWRINSPFLWSVQRHHAMSWCSLYRPDYPRGDGKYPSVWSLRDQQVFYHDYIMGTARGVRMLKSAASEKFISVDAMEVDVAYEEEMAAFTVAENDLDSGEGRADEPRLRTNLGTLAFFAPTLRTGPDGTATYSFTVPELLTRWNVRGLAVGREVQVGTLDRWLVTQKPLMVQPNMPRFLRSGDSLALMAKVVLSEPDGMEHDVEVSLLLTDAATGDTLCSQHDHLVLTNSAQASFAVQVPHGVHVATYRIVATADGMSDGEQGQVPVVTSRQAVTVSQALFINGVGEKRFSMPEWLDSDPSREPQLLAAELTANPVWLAVKTMPYIENYNDPSVITLANRLYVNTLGSRLVSQLGIDSATLFAGGSPSRLNINDDVRSTLMQATPWLRDAEGEEAQMQAVARYFDERSLKADHTRMLEELSSLQHVDGGWSWTPGYPQSDLWSSQFVLRSLAPCADDLPRQVKRGLDYIDREQQRYYERYIKPHLSKNHTCEAVNIEYLYTRSFYGKASTEAYKHFYSNALRNYRRYSNLYTQAQLALIFHRGGDNKQALDLLRKLKEKSLVSDEMGLYWRDNRSGWFWYERPVETQALIIQAFAEITPADTVTIGLMQQWLLKQKQTTHWGSNRSTTEAIRALVACAPSSPSTAAEPLSLRLFGTGMTAQPVGLEGYSSQRWSGDSLAAVRARADDAIVLRKSDSGPAWGGVYYQFTDELDRLPSSQSGISVSRTYIMPDSVRVGDRIKVRVDIVCDRNMEYLELIDGRPSCLEPVSTRSGHCWNDGLAYYIVVDATSTRCYINRLDKGKYWFEYEAYVTNPGQFMSGAVTMQCMYAPEFRAVAPGQRFSVQP